MDINKKEILEALEKCNGIVSTACKNIGLARSTFYNWLNTDNDFKEAVNEIQEVAIDFVESKLMEKINGVFIQGKGHTDDEEELPTYKVPPSDTAIIFYLKTKGKKRGYVEKTQVEHSGQINQVTIFELPDNGRD